MQAFRKSPLFLAALAVLLMSLSTGCQCCTPPTNCYSNVIDDVSDHQGCLDDCYCACFDLTRIGYADWRACRCNRIWCRRCAEKHDCDCDRYYHQYGYQAGVTVPQTMSESPEDTPEPPVPLPEPTELPPPPPEPEPLKPEHQ